MCQSKLYALNNDVRLITQFYGIQTASTCSHALALIPVCKQQVTLSNNDLSIVVANL